MINRDKIKIYRKYNADIDLWARIGTRKDKSIMVDSDWYIIDSLLQDLSLVKRGLTSLQFNKTLKSKLIESCDGEDTINQLQKLAEDIPE